MGSLFNTFLYQPLFNALIFLYETVTFQDMGVAIILLTVVIRVILYPLFYKSFKNQTMMQRLQPEMQKIQHTHKDNKEKQAQELLKLYKEHKVNPFSGFLLLFIQLPILIALYRVFLTGFNPEGLANLYTFIPQPGELNSSFLGLIDLQERSMLMVGLAAVLQYYQGKLSLPKSKPGEDLPAAAKIGRQMIFIGPALTVLILMTLPSAVGIYWAATAAFSIGQQILINKTIQKEYGNGTISGDNKKDS